MLPLVLGLLWGAPQIAKILQGIGDLAALPAHLKGDFAAGSDRGRLRAQESIYQRQLPDKGTPLVETLRRWAQEETPECKFPEAWQKGFLKGYCVEFLAIVAKHEKEKAKDSVLARFKWRS